jgi:hypothetical protein
VLPTGPALAGNGGHFHTRPLDSTAGGGAVAEVRAADERQTA